MSDCLFCKIVNKELPTDPVYEGQDLIVIKDKFPKAPIHLLVISKKHITSINHLEEVDKNLVSEIIFTAKEQAEKAGIGESGYKLVFNVGEDGGQVIPHLHLHIMGGKNLGE
jgi:histidine triad (HIT) family protein